MLNFTYHFFTDTILPLIPAGIAGTLIGIATNEYIHRKQESQLMQKYALLLESEVKGHISVIQNIRKNLSNCAIKSDSSFLVCLDTDIWKDARKYLTKLPQEELQDLAMYYQIIHQLNFLFIRPLNKENIPKFQNTLNQAELIAGVIVPLLQKEWDKKHKKQHSATYHQKKEESKSYEATYF